MKREDAMGRGTRLALLAPVALSVNMICARSALRSDCAPARCSDAVPAPSISPTVPPVLVKSTLKAYRKSPAITEFKGFPGRGHSLTIDSGWRELAEYSLSWLKAKGL